ncbi:hypothetical protein GCM10023328_47430 [Modestobacter marinus]|uniref:Uncharacterized protein n=1 Tax=Modestobacter marinus TaxID=477641 RepID=A0A846LS17_9ACTN|nr:hypothetical protein [Modestobacter marinus]NIH70281.1 hypothetical protein [Modestobacter marinus]
MSSSDDVDDDVAIVYRWMQRLCSEGPVAEEWTIEAVRRYRRQEGPSWLQHRDELLRLRFFTAQVARERRRRSS